MATTAESNLTKAIGLIAEAISEMRTEPRVTQSEVRTTELRSDDIRPRATRTRMKKTAAPGKAAQLYRSGLSVNDVAHEIGVSYPTARKMIAQGGGDIRDRAHRGPQRRRAGSAA
jgi:hypothetical protein